LNFDGGRGDVLYELIAIGVLTVVFFAIGIGLFSWRHMRAA